MSDTEIISDTPTVDSDIATIILTAQSVAPVQVVSILRRVTAPDGLVCETTVCFSSTTKAEDAA